jgi:acyl-CoA thioesterase-1
VPLRALPIVLLLVLSACRDSQPAPSPAASSAPPASAPAATDSRPVISAFGDSLTAGFGVDPGRSYPDFLQQLIDRAGYRYRVVNDGASGDTTADGLARVSFVTQQKPEIVIVEFGGNDGLRGLPVVTTRKNLESIVEAVRAAGAKIVLAGITLPPNYGPDYIRDFSSVYPAIARQQKVPLIPFLLEGVAGTREYMQPDGLHATVEGNRRVAATVMKSLEPLLKK